MRGAWKRFLIAGCLLVGTLLGSAGAFAQGASTPKEAAPVFAVRAGAGVTWDSNPFLLSSSADTQALLGTSDKSDIVSSAFVGIGIDKRYSLQRFYLDATKTANRHHNFSYLDFNPFQYRAGWDWRLGARLSGTISADRSQALVNYGDFRNALLRNLVTTEHRLASLDGLVSGGWHVLLAATEDVSKNSVTFVQVPSNRRRGGDGGIKYLAQSGSSVEFHAASARGEYLDQPLDPARLIDNGFRRSENYAIANLVLSAKSTLNGRLGWVKYKNDHFAQRDFSGTIGTLHYLWQATEKLSFVLAAARDRTPFVEDTSSYVVNDTLSLAPSWRLSSNTALTFTLSRTASDYDGAVIASTAPLRHDDLSSTELALNWTPLRSVTVNASLRHQRRSSNTAGFDFEDDVATLNASVLF